MSTATATLKEIHAHGIETAKSMPDAIVITAEMIATPGAWFAQGDVNFTPIPEIPRRAIPATPVSQLAPGTSRGSRHCVKESDMAYVEFFKLPNPNPLQGLILKFSAPTTIEHPEHKNHVYPAGSIVAVTFQRSYAAEELRRSQD
jgi:hypothetical protein